MKDLKLKVASEDVKDFLEDIFNEPINQLEEASSGKIKAVYFFNYKNKPYVILFSKDDSEFKLQNYLEEALKDKEFPFAKQIRMGNFNEFYYAISEKVEGTSINTLNKNELFETLPSIMETLIKLHSLNIESTTGYGLLDRFEEFYKEHGMDVSNIKERFLCAALCNSLDGMRFWAKLNNEGAYNAILSNILKVLEAYKVLI